MPNSASLASASAASINPAFASAIVFCTCAEVLFATLATTSDISAAPVSPPPTFVPIILASMALSATLAATCLSGSISRIDMSVTYCTAPSSKPSSTPSRTAPLAVRSNLEANSSIALTAALFALGPNKDSASWLPPNTSDAVSAITAPIAPDFCATPVANSAASCKSASLSSCAGSPVASAIRAYSSWRFLMNVACASSYAPPAEPPAASATSLNSVASLAILDASMLSAIFLAASSPNFLSAVEDNLAPAKPIPPTANGTISCTNSLAT